VPLWLALALHKRKKCRIQPPAWMSVENLKGAPRACCCRRLLARARARWRGGARRRCSASLPWLPPPFGSADTLPPHTHTTNNEQR
jgi:hypothetical protein